jgi:membrane-associated phospholipid phosphatase
MTFPLLDNIKKNIVTIYSGRNIFLQSVAFASTYLIVTTGFDWKYFTFIQSTSMLSYFQPAIILGMVIPVFGFPLLYLIAKITRNQNLLTHVWALSQSGMLGWCISSLYKAFTGRIQPPHSLLIDTSHDWNFGFMEHGIFWGWPSSHTTVAFSMAFALIALHPKRKVIVTFALVYAFYIGIGVAMRIHWFSEFVAGAIIGAVIGTVVGKSFKK